MIGRNLNLLTVPLLLLVLWALVRQLRRQRPLGSPAPLVGLVIAPLALPINLILLPRVLPGRPGSLLLAVGLGLGLAWGQTTRLEAQDQQVLARRSAIPPLCWGLSLVLIQLLIAFAPAGWLALGLAALFFSTGTTLGSNLNLLWRRLRLGAAMRRQLPLEAPELPEWPVRE